MGQDESNAGALAVPNARMGLQPDSAKWCVFQLCFYSWGPRSVRLASDWACPPHDVSDSIDGCADCCSIRCANVATIPALNRHCGSVPNRVGTRHHPWADTHLMRKCHSFPGQSQLTTAFWMGFWFVRIARKSAQPAIHQAFPHKRTTPQLMLVQFMHLNHFVTEFATCQEWTAFGQVKSKELLTGHPWFTLFTVWANTANGLKCLCR